MNRYVRMARGVGLKQADVVIAALTEPAADPRDVFAVLRVHSLVGLIQGLVAPDALNAAVSPTLAELFDGWGRRVRPSTGEVRRGFLDVRDALAAAGIPVLLLKGWYFAERLYGGVDFRPQFDVDVLVPEADFRRACRVLRTHGFKPTLRDLHSRTLVGGGCKLDVHRCLRRAPAFRVDERDVWMSAIDASAGGLAFRTLSDEMSLVLLILAAFEDVGQGMTKLRQLLDMYLLLRAIDGQTDWDEFFARRASENLCSVAVNVIALVVAIFEAEEDVPRLWAAVTVRAHLLRPLSPGDATALVFAPRKRPENLAWFGAVYPGNLTRYLAWFWSAGFPHNFSRIDARRVVAHLGVALERRRSVT